VRRRLRCDQANGENAARSARAPLKDDAAVRRSRLNIATDVVGILGPFVLIGGKGDQQRSAWDLVQRRTRRGQ
jgi:hypothetical protein